MKKFPLVSIIIPVYNAADTLPMCIASLFAQTFRDIELIFINDCSTDQTREVLLQSISEHQGADICARIIDHELNKGVAAARNTGLENASGDYIYFVDADDWIEEDLVEKLVSRAVDKQLDVVGCEWYLTYSQKERYMPQVDIETPLNGFEAMCGGVLRWNLWLFMVRRSIFEENQIRFIPGLNMGEDMMVMGKVLLSAKSIEIIHKPLYHYNQMNETSLTKEVSDRHLTQVVKNLQELETYVKKTRGGDLDESLHFLKLNIKLPLLMSDRSSSFEKWKKIFPESDSYIMKNKMLPLRTRMVQCFADKGQFWLLKIYHRVVYKFIYGVLYK